MKKRVIKKEKKISSEIQSGVLLEDLDAKLDLIVEQTSHLANQIPPMRSQLDGLTEDMFDLKAQVGFLADDVSVLKVQANILTEDVGIVKTNVEFMKGALAKKVDIDEFTALEKRVTRLESLSRQLPVEN